MVEIKILHPRRDLETLETAWGWQDAAAQWFQDTQNADEGTFKDFLLSANEKMLFGVFVDSDPTAVIRLNPAGNNVYSIDLLARRDTDMDVLTNAGLSVKEFLFDKGVNGYFGWISSKHKGIIDLYHALGFSHNGLICYKGKYGRRNRPIKWMFMESVAKGS